MTLSSSSSAVVTERIEQHSSAAATTIASTSPTKTNTTTTHPLLPAAQISCTSSTNRSIALGLIGGAFVSILSLTAPFIFVQIRSPLPYMATPRYKIEKALKFITLYRKHHASNGQTNDRLNFVDLGSGDGTAILTAAHLGYNATGFELNPTLWILSSIRRIFSTNKAVRSNSQFILADMFQSNVAKNKLRNSDCVMIFGVNSLMPKIASLIQNECHRPGCVVMSYRFRVPLLHSSSLIEKNATSTISPGCMDKTVVGTMHSTPMLDALHATLIYDEDEMRIYQLNIHNTYADHEKV